MKFRKTVIERDIARLRILLKLGLASGPYFIIIKLRLIILSKELIAISIQENMEVKITEDTSTMSLPASFRYYDCLVTSIQDTVRRHMKEE